MTESAPIQAFSLLSAAAEGSPISISGPLIEVDAINKNGWGIGANEIKNYMAGLIGVPLRKCAGADELVQAHSCDYNWNPNDDIGRITGASVIDGWVHAVAEITDSIAQRKISEGTWVRKWSAFLSHTAQSAKNMLSGTKALSVTLVDDPAYSGAQFALKEAGKMVKDKETYTKEDVEKLVAAATEEAAKGLLSKEDVDKLVSAAVKKEEEKGKDLVSKEDLDKLVTAGIEEAKVAAESAAKKKETDGDTLTKGQAEEMVSAAVAAATEGTILREDVEKLVAASVETAKKATRESIEKDQLVKDVLEVQVSAGIVKGDATEEALGKLNLKSAATLKEDLQLLEKVTTVLKAAGTEAVNKFKEANIPSAGGDRTRTTGVYTPGKGYED